MKEHSSADPQHKHVLTHLKRLQQAHAALHDDIHQRVAAVAATYGQPPPQPPPEEHP